METKWISIEEALPEPKQKVLLYCKPIGICVGYFWGLEHDNVPSEPCKGWSIMNVTHWMPLVEPPEGLKDIIQKG
jgi:hypothetical protein